MLTLIGPASTASVLSNPDLDLDLRVLTGLRVRHLGDDTKLFVVQAGDTPEVINKALGCGSAWKRDPVSGVIGVE